MKFIPFASLLLCALSTSALQIEQTIHWDQNFPNASHFPLSGTWAVDQFSADQGTLTSVYFQAVLNCEFSATEINVFQFVWNKELGFSWDIYNEFGHDGGSVRSGILSMQPGETVTFSGSSTFGFNGTLTDPSSLARFIGEGQTYIELSGGGSSPTFTGFSSAEIDFDLKLVFDFEPVIVPAGEHVPSGGNSLGMLLFGIGFICLAKRQMIAA